MPKISELTSDTPASTDEVPVHDTSGGDTNKVTVGDLLAVIDDSTTAQAIAPTWTGSHQFDSDVSFEGLGFRQRVEMLAAHLVEDLELEVDEISHGQAASRILGLNSLSSDPADPDAGEGLLWVSDGGGTGTDGDLVYKVTNSAGTTKTFVIGDFSAN